MVYLTKKEQRFLEDFDSGIGVDREEFFKTVIEEIELPNGAISTTVWKVGVKPTAQQKNKDLLKPNLLRQLDAIHGGTFIEKMKLVMQFDPEFYLLTPLHKIAKGIK